MSIHASLTSAAMLPKSHMSRRKKSKSNSIKTYEDISVVRKQHALHVLKWLLIMF